MCFSSLRLLSPVLRAVLAPGVCPSLHSHILSQKPFLRGDQSTARDEMGLGAPSSWLAVLQLLPFASNCTQSHGVHGNFPNPKKPKGHRKDAQRDSGRGSSAVTHAVAASPAVSLSPGTSVLRSPKPAVASKVKSS